MTRRRLISSALLAVCVLSGVLRSERPGLAESNVCTISLQPGEPSPQLVGEPTVWTAVAANCGANPVYRFSVAGTARAGEDEAFDPQEHQWKHERFSVVRDFSPDNSFAWAPMREGSYRIEVSVKDGFDATNATSVVVPDKVDSRVTGTEAVVTLTANPLVALYSAPACAEGAVFVAFRPSNSSGDIPWVTTNSLPCMPGLSRNFLVAGMLANTTYEMVHVTREGLASSPRFFTTGAPPTTLSIPRFTVRQAPGPQSDLRQIMIFHNLAARPAANDVNLLATDLLGRVEWYCDPQQEGLVGIGNPGSRLLRGGTVLLAGRDRHRTLGLNVLREIDLGGNPLLETDLDAVNAQLKTSGRPIIYGFHHDYLRLPNGDIATLGWTRKKVVANGALTDYVGDLLIVLDRNLRVVWTWDAFDHLDVNRGPIFGETCTGQPCPIPGGVNWLNSNAIAWSAEDGNLLLSLRNQSWVIKIDYAHGTGDGHVIWRLGMDGDFAVNSTDAAPWFSYQHNPHYLDRRTLLLFDNGNVRRASDPNAHSRGQVWKLNERTMTATLVLNADLGNYSEALGSAERLPNGNFAFMSGFLGQPPAIFGESIEVLPDGTKTYVLEATAAREYRSYRIADLYRGIRP